MDHNWGIYCNSFECIISLLILIVIKWMLMNKIIYCPMLRYIHIYSKDYLSRNLKLSSCFKSLVDNYCLQCSHNITKIRSACWILFPAFGHDSHKILGTVFRYLVEWRSLLEIHYSVYYVRCTVFEVRRLST